MSRNTFHPESESTSSPPAPLQAPADAGCCGHAHSHAETHGHDRSQGHDHDSDDGHGHGHGHNHSHAQADAADACCGATSFAPPAPPLSRDALPADAEMARYRIEAMDCPTEETLIRNKLGNMAGVAALEFNLMQRVLTVHHTLASPDVLVKAIASLGMQAQPLADDASRGETPTPETAKPWWPLAAAGVLALGAEASEWMQLGMPWLPVLCALAAVALSGLTTYRKGWISIRNANLNINALMSIAVTGALVLRQWPEAAMVMVLFAVAERIEAASLDRARNAIRGLMAMTPEQATVRAADGSWQPRPAAGVAVGEVVRLRPGERVALDGKVLRGESALDQAPITGESVPSTSAPAIRCLPDRSTRPANWSTR
jgi:Cd2+/Zn2+-exporting ATPase